MKTKLDIKEKFLCPITGQIMFDPVSAPDGQTYERDAIVRWLEQNGTSPHTREGMAIKHLNRNSFAKDAIYKFIKTHVTAYPEVLNDLYVPLRSFLTAVVKKDLDTVRKFLHLDTDMTQNNPRLFDCMIPKDDPSVDQLFLGKSVFHIILEHGNTDLVKLYINTACRVSGQIDKIKAVQLPEALDLKYLNYALLDGAKAGDTYFVKLSLDLGANIQVKDDSEGQNTPLHQASKYGRTESVKLLVQRGAQLEATSVDGSTPLNYSAFYAQIGAMNMLLDAGASVIHQDTLGNTPLHDAVDQDKPEALKVLIARGASKSIKNTTGETAVDLAMKNGHTALVKLMHAAFSQRKSQVKVYVNTLEDTVNQQKSDIKALKAVVAKLENKVEGLSNDNGASNSVCEEEAEQQHWSPQFLG